MPPPETPVVLRPPAAGPDAARLDRLIAERVALELVGEELVITDHRGRQRRFPTFRADRSAGIRTLCTLRYYLITRAGGGPQYKLCGLTRDADRVFSMEMIFTEADLRSFCSATKFRHEERKFDFDRDLDKGLPKARRYREFSFFLWSDLPAALLTLVVVVVGSLAVMAVLGMVLAALLRFLAG